MSIETDVFEVLDSFCQVNYGGKEIQKETPLDDLFKDSLDSVELLIELEEKFSIEITDDEAETWPEMNVRDLIEFVEKRVG